MEVARSKEGTSLSQWKYVLDTLDEIGLMGSKVVDTPIYPNVKLCIDQGEFMANPNGY